MELFKGSRVFTWAIKEITPLHVFAFVNSASGSVPPDGADQLSAALAALGSSYQLEEIRPETMKHQLDTAVFTRPDVLIVWGGDGTIACALNAAGAAGPPVLALPGGTMNLLHKNIHGSALDWKTCLQRSLYCGQRVHIPAGRVATRRFYVAAMIGALTRLVEPRELLREGEPIKAIRKLGNGSALKLKSSLSVATPDRKKPLQMTALAILPSLVRKNHLEIASIDPDTPIELVLTGLTALTGHWRSARGVDRRFGRSATVHHASRSKLEVTLDGEPVRLASGSRFTRLERAALVISAAPE